MQIDGEITMEGNPTGPEPCYWSVEEAAKAANAHTFISELPEGYDTQVEP